jgi:two-component system cell cycle response regulator DivK
VHRSAARRHHARRWVRHAPPHASADGAAEDGAEAPPFVLIVDDVEDNRDLYATYFAVAGFRVATANDGEEALGMITREAPDAVVMDLAMPNLDGWEATRLIKANPRTAAIVVVVVSGHAVGDAVRRARAAGADEVLAKPCYPDQLVARVCELLSLEGAPPSTGNERLGGGGG